MFSLIISDLSPIKDEFSPKDEFLLDINDLFVLSFLFLKVGESVK